ncbi:MAG: hypothetical protein M3434_06345 [Gemmatimonadota bacterium]|jgi:hypothetical protein|nr:hypothetical protein [Gemmatimonadota bacterium]
MTIKRERRLHATSATPEGERRVSTGVARQREIFSRPNASAGLVQARPEGVGAPRG